MKYLLLIITITCCFFSCKKTYTCTCEEKITGSSSYYNKYTTEFSNDKYTKKEAQSICKAAEGFADKDKIIASCPTCRYEVNCNLK